MKTLRCKVEGRVQGVGYRYWVYCRARECGLRGWVRNLAGGSVEVVVACGSESGEGGAGEAVLSEFCEALRRGPDGARVRAVTCGEAASAFPEAEDFEIR